ncbi:hypothetical protein BC835DRAFT_1523662 [Cytidiella melzeri]|nr:hypothetical protein BC835DRAFT_1523662 [Cytidiella melzeri]
MTQHPQLMTLLLRGLAFLKRNAPLGTRTYPHPLRPHASIHARLFATQAFTNAQERSSPALKAVEFPKLELNVALKVKNSKERALELIHDVQKSSALPANYEAIPTIPPRPKPGLTQWVSDGEVRQYLHPLYSRQWKIAKYLPPESTKRIHYQLLSKFFVFRTEKDAMEFSMGITEIVNKMAHHPTIFKLREKTIIFRILTHDAYVELDENGPIVVPGVTMHDIRVAMRLEKLWEKYWAQGKAKLPRLGWKLKGHKRTAVRYWGIRVAKLKPPSREEVARTRVRLRRSWPHCKGKGATARRKPRKKRKTPRWKKMKWKKRARRQSEAQDKAAAEVATQTA